MYPGRENELPRAPRSNRVGTASTVMVAGDAASSRSIRPIPIQEFHMSATSAPHGLATGPHDFIGDSEARPSEIVHVTTPA